MGMFGPSSSERAAETARKAEIWGESIKKTMCLGMSTYQTGDAVTGYTIYTQGTFVYEKHNGYIGCESFDTTSPYFTECIKKLDWVTASHPEKKEENRTAPQPTYHSYQPKNTSATPQSATWTCSKCGTKNSKDTYYCKDCGTYR